MTIVYQAYGNEQILKQTILSIISLYQYAEDFEKIEILIYTDRTDYFKAFFDKQKSIYYAPVTSEQIKKWRGNIDFVHRVKLEVLIDASKKVRGHIFYLDSDTVFTKDPRELFTKISPAQSLMHVAEVKLDAAKDPLTKKICKFVKKHKFSIPMSEQTVMWNAGVIGVDKSNTHLLSQALQLTDEMYRIYPKHVMEQLAVSAVLQNQTLILPCDSAIYHYWDKKSAFDLAIQKLLSTVPANKLIGNYKQFAWPKAEPKKRVSIFARLLGNFANR
jgi:hypothetical protein